MKAALNRLLARKGLGTARGALRHVQFRLMLQLGLLSDFEKVDWARVQRLVFVCKGNICRSPYAEAKARALGADAASFGLHAAHLEPADPVAIRCAAARGVDLAGHRSRLLSPQGIRPGDVVVGFEPWHATGASDVLSTVPAQITLAGLWADTVRPYLHDPYGREEVYFQSCYAIIDAAVAGMVQRMRRGTGVQVG